MAKKLFILHKINTHCSWGKLYELIVNPIALTRYYLSNYITLSLLNKILLDPHVYSAPINIIYFYQVLN